jgi:hypothetical protein
VEPLVDVCPNALCPNADPVVAVDPNAEGVPPAFPNADVPVAGAPNADVPVAGAPNADLPEAGIPNADVVTADVGVLPPLMLASEIAFAAPAPNADVPPPANAPNPPPPPPNAPVAGLMTSDPDAAPNGDAEGWLAWLKAEVGCAAPKAEVLPNAEGVVVDPNADVAAG